MRTVRSFSRACTSVHGMLVDVNQLTSKDDLDPITGMATYCAIPVTLEPASAGRG